jgi:hypothetical protein
MKDDSVLNDTLQQLQTEVTSTPSIVDDVMQRIEQKPMPVRCRGWNRTKVVAACTTAAACLAVAIGVWIVAGGDEPVKLASTRGNQAVVQQGQEGAGLTRLGPQGAQRAETEDGEDAMAAGNVSTQGRRGAVSRGLDAARLGGLPADEASRGYLGIVRRGVVQSSAGLAGLRGGKTGLGGIEVHFSIFDGCKVVLYQNAKWGFIDRTGKVVIEAKYDGVGPFSEGLASATVDEKAGYIDRAGRIVIEPQFDMALPFREGLAVVAVDDKWGYIDKQGRDCIPPQYDLARDFHEGLAVVEVGGKAGFIDRTGRVVVEPKYGHAGRFSEGLALVRIEPECEEDQTKRLLGFIDHTGKLVIELGTEFTGASRFSDGLAVVGNSEGKAGFIDRDGKLAIPCRYDSVDLFSEHRKGLAMVSHPEQGTASFIDKTGAVAIERPHWLMAEYSPEADVLIGCYEDPATGETVQTRFDPSRMRPLAGGLMMFSVDAKEQAEETYGCIAQRWGFGDQTGIVVIEPEFEEVAEFSEGLAGFATNLDWEAFGAAVYRMEQSHKEMDVEVD